MKNYITISVSFSDNASVRTSTTVLIKALKNQSLSVDCLSPESCSHLQVRRVISKLSPVR